MHSPRIESKLVQACDMLRALAITAQECAHEAERALRYALQDGACIAAVARLAEANERAQNATKQAREAVNALQSAAVELLKSETEGMR